MSSEYKINIEVAKIKNLPPLPDASIKIITAVNNSDVYIDELVDVLSLSPVLMARLIGLSNSAYFGRAGKISDLRVAIIQVLGLKLVKSLSLSIVLNVELDVSQCQLFDAELFWKHALMTAIIAQKLSVKFDNELMTPATVYTAGLLLDIGFLAAVFVFPQQVNEVLAESENREGSVSENMHRILGLTHYEIGAILLETWQLPEIYKVVVQQFRKADFQGEEKQLIVMLELSHWLATFIMSDNQQEMPDFSALLSQLSITEKEMQKVVNDVNENKDNISELANIISG